MEDVIAIARRLLRRNYLHIKIVALFIFAKVDEWL